MVDLYPRCRKDSGEKEVVVLLIGGGGHSPAAFSTGKETPTRGEKGFMGARDLIE